MQWSNKAIRKWMRIIHRDLGFLMVGITIIYGISGYVLNHMDGTDPAYHTIENTVQLAQNLSAANLMGAWEQHDDLPAVKRVLPIDEEHYRLMLDGGIGVYRSTNGEVLYEHHQKKPFIHFINKLHYNRVGGWTLLADIFAFALIFFAISGLFMVKGRKGILGRGKWYLLIGIAIPIIYAFLM
ncbi:MULTISPECIES: PepSY-associated TM helix domain-containing protein [unclassified Carboxylicivirga]|uniref:PepSY-associated TM helix domain-containing protein n=1 Tax=Carboxylicivirga TaxID=1628153 RepID=UPI003D34A587